jgi:hypothetical protein
MGNRSSEGCGSSFVLSHVRSGISLATQQFKRRAYPQHCYGHDNRHRDVSMVTRLLCTDFYWFVVSPCLEIAECKRVCVCLATDSFWLEDWVSIGKLREKHVCLEISWLQEWEFVPEERRGWARTCVWRLSDCKNVSSFWEITGRGHVEGFLCGTSLSVNSVQRSVETTYLALPRVF